MRSTPWTGLRQDTTDLGEESWAQMNNIMLRIKGELRDRPGLGLRYPLAANVMGYLESGGTKMLFGARGTYLYSADVDSRTGYTLKTGMTSAIGCFANSNGVTYYANGTDNIQAIDGLTSIRDAGIDAPAGEPTWDGNYNSGYSTFGVHLVRYRYKNSSNGYLSNPSDAVTLDVSLRTYSTGIMTVTNGSTSATLAGGTMPAAWRASCTAVINGVTIGGTSSAGSGTALTLGTKWNGASGDYTYSITEITADGGRTITVSYGGSSNPDVDKVVVEMTQASGSVYYIVNEYANGNGSADISITDANLAQNQLANIFSAPDGFGHEPPPSGLFCITEHRNRLFGLTSDGTLYWSRAGFPESWNALSWGKRVFSDGGDAPVALMSFYNDLYIFGRRGMARLVYTGDPANGMLVQIPAALGTYSQRTICRVEGSIFGMGIDGIWRIDAMQPEFISTPVQQTLAGLDATQASSAHVFYDPQERVVWHMYQETGDSGVRSAVCFDVRSGEWSTRSFRHSIVAAISASVTNSGSAVYVADNNGGYVWRLDDGVWDGVPSTMSSGVVTAAAGSTTTVINVAESLDTATGLVGAILYDPSDDTEHRITANTATTVTIATALSGTPSLGQTYYIGSIESILESGWVPMHYAFVGRRVDILKVEHLSVSASLGVDVKVEWFQDYSDSPMVWTSVPDDAALTGGTVVDGATYATWNLDGGKAMIQAPSDFNTVIKWRLTRNKPTGRMRILDASINPRDQKKAQEIPH